MESLYKWPLKKSAQCSYQSNHRAVLPAYHRREGKAKLHVQTLILLSNDMEPKPDLALVKLRDDAYAEAHPSPNDVLILVEVSDTTETNKGIKLPRYAASDIPEVWIVNLVDEIIEVYVLVNNMLKPTTNYMILSCHGKTNLLSPTTPAQCHWLLQIWKGTGNLKAALKEARVSEGTSTAGNLVLSNEDIERYRNLTAMRPTPLGARDKPNNERLLNLDSETPNGGTTYR